MNNKEKQKQKNSKEIKNSSPDEYKEILLEDDKAEDPNLIIDKLLINLFNQLIMNKNEIEENFILFYKKKIKELCQKHLKKNIVLFLFININKIIQRYRQKLFEIPNMMDMRLNYMFKNELRSSSYKEKYSKKYFYFAIEQKKKSSYDSSKKIKIFDYNLVMKNLFNKLLWIKNCLKKAVPIIEKIFEYPLSCFKIFSVEGCTKEDFFRNILHDNFIWNEIIKNKRGEFKSLIEEILEDYDLNNFSINIIENKIEYFNKFTKKTLQIQNAQSSLDTRTPEEAIKISTIYYEDDHEKLLNEEKDMYNNSGNINMYKFNSNDFVNNNFDINKALFASETLKEITKLNNLKINNINKDSLNLEKNFSFPGKTVKVSAHTHINNLNNKSSQKSEKSDNDSNSNNKFNKKRFHKKIETNSLKNKNNEENKNKKEEKNEIIPNDLDDLVKYIKDDNTQNKKKKKNRKKTKKRNKNNPANAEGESDNKREHDEIKDKDDDNFIDDEKDIQMFKEDLSRNSINRFHIHKIKFKYRPKYLQKISNLEN